MFSYGITMKEKVGQFIRDDEGVTAIEYAVVVAGVAAVVMFIFGNNGPVKEMLNSTFEDLTSKMTANIESIGKDTGGTGTGTGTGTGG